MVHVFILRNDKVNWILPPMVVIKNYGKHITKTGDEGELLLVKGPSEKIIEWANRHDYIWMGIPLTEDYEKDKYNLTLWYRPN